MRWLLWFLALFALAVGVALLAGHNDGYVLIVLSPWRVEVSLNFFIVAVIGGFALIYALLRAIIHTLNLPQSVRNWRELKRREKAQGALREAALQLFEGRYGQAIKNASLSYSANESPALSALVAARAASHVRDYPRMKEWLGRAAEHDVDIRAARLMTEAELAVNARRYDDALEALHALHENGRRHIAALRLSLRIYRGVGQWSEVLRVARQLQNHKVLSAEAAAPLKLRAHLENIRGKAGDALALATYWKAIPADERNNPQLAAAAAKALTAAGDTASAQRIIEAQLDKEWDSELAELYGTCKGEDAVSSIAKAEKWLTQHRPDARLLLALARLCREQQLWGKAQSYFETSLSVQPSQSAYAELAALFDELGKPEEANRAYRQAAKLCLNTY